MTTTDKVNDPGKPDVRRKDRYHHGDLREALIAATRQLLVERGPEDFSLSDACRLAGVSTAAPYKHFRDKDEILEEIAERGFEELEQRSLAAVGAAGVGTLDGIVAMGHAYLRFAREESAMFRLMFGQDMAVKQAAKVEECGRACFTNVIMQVEIFCAENRIAGHSQALALELWTFVHGAAHLLIDKDYDKIAPGLDVEGMITRVTPRLLGVKA